MSRLMNFYKIHMPSHMSYLRENAFRFTMTVINAGFIIFQGKQTSLFLSHSVEY